MGIRETINKRPAVAIGMLLGGVAIALVSFLALGHNASPAANVQTKAWFTDDDGRTWFPDEAEKIPPFDRGGKQAVRCHVWRCSDGTEWAAYLMRYTPEGKRRQAEAAKSSNFDTSAIAAMREAIEIKPPRTGDSGWVRLSSPAAAAVRAPACPHGLRDHASPSEPL